MIDTFLAAMRFIGERPGKSFLVLTGVIIVLIVGLRLWSLQSTVNEQTAQITKLTTALEVEKLARKADDRGLTALFEGTRIDQIKNEQDQGALEHAVQTTPTTGLSPFMRAYFDCLRNHADGKGCPTGSVSPSPAK